MGIIVKWREAHEYVDGIDLNNLEVLEDGLIPTRDRRNNEEGNQENFIYQAYLQMIQGNPVTISLTYSQEHNQELVDREQIILGTLTFTVEGDQYHGTGQWASEGEQALYAVTWTDGRRQYYWNLVRPEQAPFRAIVMQAYNSTCAITGCATEEALEAAHVVPVAENGDYALENGILLRRDIHRLFDLNLVAVDPESMVAMVSDHILADYGEFCGAAVNLPDVGPEPHCFNGRWELFQAEAEDDP